MLGKHSELYIRLPKSFRMGWKNSYLLAPSCRAASMLAVSNTLINGCPKEDQGGFPLCKADCCQELKQDRRLAKQDITGPGLNSGLTRYASSSRAAMQPTETIQSLYCPSLSPQKMR